MSENENSQPNGGGMVMTSCPELAFKNYKNVFAEITKNVLGEIENSDNESQLS